MDPSGMTSIFVRHNMEVAHRLTKLPGKCQQIHGHSMWVKLEMWGEIDDSGIMEGMPFGDVKDVFRHHMDTELDHHFLVNHEDPVTKLLKDAGFLVAECIDDPTTENIAKWLGQWAYHEFVEEGGILLPQMRITVDETFVNSATWEWCLI